MRIVFALLFFAAAAVALDCQTCIQSGKKWCSTTKTCGGIVLGLLCLGAITDQAKCPVITTCTECTQDGKIWCGSTKNCGSLLCLLGAVKETKNCPMPTTCEECTETGRTWNVPSGKCALKCPEALVLLFRFSFGAGLAAMFAARQKIEIRQTNVSLLTFGETRIGNQQFADFIEDKIPYAYRITNANDYVVTLNSVEDPSVMRRFEIWYQNGMATGQNYTLCQMQDAPYCSTNMNAAENSSIPDHKQAFGVDVVEWGKAGCP